MRLPSGCAGGLKGHPGFGLQDGKKCFEYKPLIGLLRWSYNSTFGKHPILAGGKKYEFLVYLWTPRFAEITFLTIDGKIL